MTVDLPSIPAFEPTRRQVITNRFTRVRQTVVTPQPEPPAYAAERTRFIGAIATARGRVAANAQARAQLTLVNTQRAAQVADYSRIQTEYARYASAAETTDVIREVNKSLVPFRPPTAPASDIEIERKAILSITNQELLVAQIALFAAVLVLLTYVIVPGNTAHIVAFLLIVCAVAAAFFLRK